jgi:hypothetical protein
MRFATSSEHREFFNKHRYIEFSDLLSEEEAATLKTHAQALLLKRAERKQTPDRDLWRDDPFIKKTLFHPRFSEIAATLLKKPILRLAYDQYFAAPSSLLPKTAATLQHISAFQSIAGGLILQLASAPHLPAPLPRQPGHGLLFGPDLPLPFAELSECILIAYCNDRTLYILDKHDPHTHFLKKFGYVFGDALKNETHPLLFR